MALGPRLAYVSTEQNGVGAMPSQELSHRLGGTRGRRDWLFVATTNRSKTAGYGALLGLLEQSQLVLPRDPDLLRQLAGLRFEQGERGFTRIEAEDPATHDDVADAAMLATLPHSRAGRVICEITRLAHPRRAVAEARVGDLDEEIVETGGGLRLYRRPPLQSVAGPEVAPEPPLRYWHPARGVIPVTNTHR